MKVGIIKKFPITLIPLVVLVIVTTLFAWVVPDGADLISANGDVYLGRFLADAVFVCLIIDTGRFCMWLFTRNGMKQK